MNIALWVIQALVAAAFVVSGGMKAGPAGDKLAKLMPYSGGLSLSLVRFISVAEILGGLGLILPMLTGIAPALTIAAAVGLVLIMILAAIFHASRGEFFRVPANVVLAILAVVIAYGRLAVVPA
jgi:putative oxidoreductase